MWKTVLAYAAIYLIWGSTYLFMKFAGATMPPFYVVGVRFFAGGAGLLVLALLWRRGRALPSGREILASLAIGALLLAGGNGLTQMAMQGLDSHLCALVVASVPIPVLLFDRMFLGRPIPLHAAAGAMVGLAGVALLLHDGGHLLPSPDPNLFLLLGAICCWALGTTLSKRLPLPADRFLNAGIQLFAVGLGTLLLLQPLQPATAVDWAAVTLRSWAGVAYLAVMGSAALAAYAWLLKHEPNHRVVSYALVNPPIAVGLGIVAGHETPAPYLVPAVLCILAGVGVLLYGDRWRARPPVAPPP